MTRTHDGVAFKSIQDGQSIPVNVHAATRQIVSANATFAVEQEISRHHVSRNVNDHRIVGVAGSCMKLNRNRTQHDFLFVIDVNGDA